MEGQRNGTIERVRVCTIGASWGTSSLSISTTEAWYAADRLYSIWKKTDHSLENSSRVSEVGENRIRSNWSARLDFARNALWVMALWMFCLESNGCEFNVFATAPSSRCGSSWSSLP